jgi:hypothetical protein
MAVFYTSTLIVYSKEFVFRRKMPPILFLIALIRKRNTQSSITFLIVIIVHIKPNICINLVILAN